MDELCFALFRNRYIYYPMNLLIYLTMNIKRFRLINEWKDEDFDMLDVDPELDKPSFNPSPCPRQTFIFSATLDNFGEETQQKMTKGKKSGKKRDTISTPLRLNQFYLVYT
jgi:hypothetical protein